MLKVYLLYVVKKETPSTLLSVFIALLCQFFGDSFFSFSRSFFLPNFDKLKNMGMMTRFSFLQIRLKYFTVNRKQSLPIMLKVELKTFLRAKQMRKR
jgi:ABC-type bacteriocin/lantibiotic exporter with double-glycine peptidase domain